MSANRETNRPAPLAPILDAIEGVGAVDAPAKKIAKTLRASIPGGGFKDVISGTFLGHPLHPLLTDVVIGSFTSATLLDFLSDDDAAARRLIGVGIAAYGPTALSGASDWADSEPGNDDVRRVGIVHAISNSVALTLYAGSLVARRRGSRGKGRALALAGAGVLGFAGYLGGHLSFAKGIGVDQTIFDPGESEWQDVIAAADLSEGAPQRALAGDSPVMLVRSGGRIHALHDRCSHRGCSLAEGEIDGDEVVCACHGSRFSLLDGAIRRGPAVAPQPAFEVREQAGQIAVRSRSA